jgi:hypothetical protein
VTVGVEFLAQAGIGRVEHVVLDESVALSHAELQPQLHVIFLAGDQTQLIVDALEGIRPGPQPLLEKLALRIADRRPRAFFTSGRRNQMHVTDAGTATFPVC